MGRIRNAVPSPTPPQTPVSSADGLNSAPARPSPLMCGARFAASLAAGPTCAEDDNGLRHAYAQTRYEKLTGWKAPAAGGPTSLALSPSPEQKAVDREVRLIISRELGHEREQVTSIYLSR